METEALLQAEIGSQSELRERGIFERVRGLVIGGFATMTLTGDCAGRRPGLWARLENSTESARRKPCKARNSLKTFAGPGYRL
jgi:hypothetical protein